MPKVRVTRETHDTPKEIRGRLAEAGGLNLYGEPNYRVVWGWNRLSWIGGDWDKYDEHENYQGTVYLLQQCPKYICTNEEGHITFDRWILEKWISPEKYGSASSWNYRELGPFPSEGEYEHSETIETPAHGFVQITPSITDYLVGRIERSRAIDGATRLEALKRREQKRLDDENKKMYDILSDTSPYLKGSYVTVS